MKFADFFILLLIVAFILLSARSGILLLRDREFFETMAPPLPPDLKCSVVILNYNRPHNIPNLISALEKMKCIDEIIISNHHADYAIKQNQFSRSGDLVKVHDDFGNEIGAADRFEIMLRARNNFVITLDDDLVPSEQLVHRMLLSVNQEPYNIHGPIMRRGDRSGYYTNDSKSNNLVLTGLVITSKEVLRDYLETEFPKHIQWFKKHRGNCEDISMNVFLIKKNITPRQVRGRFADLDKSQGYSSSSDHYKIRSEFCRLNF
jgi:GT2 family glycosyltransferase